MISPLAAAVVTVNSIERPLLLPTPNSTPVIAHAGVPSYAISPLFSPAEADAMAIPALASDPTDSESLQRGNSEQQVQSGDNASAGNVDGGQIDSEGAFSSVAAERTDRLHAPARFSWGVGQGQPGQPAVGIPRIVGMPVEDAIMFMPDNCCEDRCGGLPCPRAELSETKRMRVAKIAYCAALNVLAFCFCADVLLFGGTMPWNDLKPDATKELTRSYVDRCIQAGEPPYEVRVGAVLYILAAAVTLITSIPLLLISRGCILCCAPAPCCGKVCSAGALLVFSLFHLAVSMPIYFWLLYWPFKDMQACAACKFSTFSGSGANHAECEASLTAHDGDLISGTELVFFYNRGIGTVVGLLSACAIAKAGYYCALVPSAIRC